jgi:CheY-like chemotaxis protein
MQKELFPRLLIVDGDRPIRILMRDVLSEMGYGCTVAADPEQALRVLHRQPVDLLVTDSFSHSAHDVLAGSRPLLHLAHPVPVILCTAWPLTAADLQEAAFTAVVRKPFALDDLVTTVAACLGRPFSAAHVRQAAIVQGYLAALGAWDGDTLGALMTKTVALYPWLASPYPAAHRAVGRSAVLAYIQEMARYFGPVQVQDTRLFACPRGLATRFLVQWHRADGIPQQQIACLCFQLDDSGLIAQVGHPRQGVFPRTLLDAAAGEQPPRDP